MANKFDKELFSKMDESTCELVVFEALLRRVCMVNMPFALKGSLLTRQYFPQHENRYVEDMDFFYMEKILDVAGADDIFTSWMCAVTTQDVDDGVEIRDFKENTFWRMIDYAMEDDFPTVNTDIDCKIPGTHNGRKGGEFVTTIGVDVSFNLEMNADFVPLLYKPVFGEEFIVPYTIPLPAQIAWKLHQTIIRPRYKDVYDLRYLISHPSYDNYGVEETLRLLADECRHDKALKKEKIYLAFTENPEHLHKAVRGKYSLYFWLDSNWKQIPEEMSQGVVQEFVDAMQKAGLTYEAFRKYFYF